MTTNAQLKGYADQLPKRGISERVCEKYKVYRDGNTLRFHYYSRDGLLLGAKVKTLDKQFSYEGETDGSFFGQHLFPSKGKRVVITEGELDALSLHECFPTWPHVSLPTGAAGAKKACQRNLEWLQGYDEIVLWFDDDEPGRQAVKAAASVLPPNKVKIAKAIGDYKDASDALQANDFNAIERAVYDAKPYRPDGIVDGQSIYELVTTPNPPSNHEYPVEGLNKLLHGIRYGELVTITAGSGIGKSSFCRELATSLLQDGERVGYLALEESNRRTALGLMSVAVGESLHLGVHEKDKLEDAFDRTMATWNLYLYDGFGSYDPDVIYNRIDYLANGLDCRIIFLDHLSILLSGLDGDERRMIDTTMTKLRSLVERTGIALFLVSHLRRTQTDHNHEEGARVTIGQLRGSASIAQLSDGVIALERNQQSGSDDSATTIRVLKNRYSGETGIAGQLTYDLNTCKFTEHEAKPDFNATTDF
jgi:twinkle protein